MPREIDGILSLIRNEIARVRTACPGVVLSYDRTRQTAVVQMVVRERWRDPDTDAIVTEALPPLPDVPVLYPGGGGASIVWDLVPGDAVWVVVADRSIAEWKATGRDDVEPQSPRRWDLSDAVAIPAGRPPAAPLAGGALPAVPGTVVVRGTIVQLGSSAATSPVALAPVVDANLAALEVALDGAIAAGIAASGGGLAAALTAMQVALAASLAAWPVASGATKVRAE